jgi:hypothetical protein
MRVRLLMLPLAAALLCLTGCVIEDFDVGSKYNRDFHYTYPMKPDGRINVETFNGSVDISGWDQATVDISGTKFGPTQEAADALRVDISNSPEGVAVRIVRPSERRNNMGAKLVIKVPRSAVLDRIVTSNASIHTVDGAGDARLHTSNGSIRVQDLRGRLNAETSNSSVELQAIAGDVTVRTSNGHIRTDGVEGGLDLHTSNSSVNLKAARGDRPIRIESSNGSVDVTLPVAFSSTLRANTSNSSITVRAPSEPDARLTAHTSNSSITSDFDIRMQGELSKNRLDGTLGRGNGLIDLETSNGSVRVVRM